jgi:hypothetical protein
MVPLSREWRRGGGDPSRGGPGLGLCFTVRPETLTLVSNTEVSLFKSTSKVLTNVLGPRNFIK